MTLEVSSEIRVERILDERLATAQLSHRAFRQLVEIHLAERVKRIRDCRMKQKILRHVVEATALNARALREIHGQQKDFVLHIRPS